MLQIFLKLIEQLNSSVFILIALLLLAAVGIYKMGKWSEIFKHHDDKITKVESLADKVLVMGTKVDLIYEHTLGSKRVVVAMSPINLTEIGKEIVEKIKANIILERCLPQVVKEVEVEKQNNAYDIQMASMKVAKEKMVGCLNEEELTAIKDLRVAPPLKSRKTKVQCAKDDFTDSVKKVQISFIRDFAKTTEMKTAIFDL